jgi:hypothetical protein
MSSSNRTTCELTPPSPDAWRKPHCHFSGWVYHIGHGTVRIDNEEQRKFLPVTGDEQAASGGASQ